MNISTEELVYDLNIWVELDEVIEGYCTLSSWVSLCTEQRCKQKDLRHLQAVQCPPYTVKIILHTIVLTLPITVQHQVSVITTPQAALLYVY